MADLDPDAFRLLARLHVVAESLTSVAVWASRTSPTCDGHVHAVPTLVVALDGVVRISGARTRLDLHPGEALLLSPGAWHRHEPLRPGCGAFLQGFLAGGSDINLDHAGGSHCGLLPVQPSWRLLTGALAAGPADRVDLVRSCLEQALTERVRPLGSMPPAVGRMAHRLWWDPSADLQIADLVRASGLQASRAHAAFKAWFGTTPKQALLGLRAARALQDLREGAGIAEASERAGFASRVLLTRAFRARYGLPPSCWAEIRDEPPP
jgi:AraC-like DNA-binding protein